MRFKDEVTKKKYVTESFGRKLTLKIDDEEINVSCSHDKTFKQREEEKRLHRELTVREAQGETNLKIRSGRIIQNFQNVSGGTRTTWANIVANLN